LAVALTIPVTVTLTVTIAISVAVVFFAVRECHGSNSQARGGADDSDRR